ncbi:hypothetical protein [Candidatus Palauibacter sp.]|uniref:hypothetical protein n=1 Tax=Candidatus Palauibacter sp. TaxID=3101350 RepID=UPI003B59EB65
MASAFLLVCGCGDEGILVDGGNTGVVVVGTVTDARGLAVAGALVRVDAWLDVAFNECGLSFFNDGHRRPTDENGRYSSGWGLPGALGGGTTYDGCVSVSVTPPAESGLLPAMRDRIRVTFYSHNDPDRRDADPVVVDVVLPPAEAEVDS